MINGYLMWVGKQNDLLAGLEKREYFHASPFVGEDDQADWKNYGGIWWDNDVQADWVEDGRGLTEKQATGGGGTMWCPPPVATFPSSASSPNSSLAGQLVRPYQTVGQARARAHEIKT